jgi:hypothetical protein
MAEGGNRRNAGGSVVFNRLWASVHNRVVSAQVEAARRRVVTAGERPVTASGLGTRLTGDRIRLDRLTAVWPETVVVVFHGDAVHELRYPGDVVVPPVFPRRTPTYVLPVATGPVTVDVEVTNAATLEGYRLEQVVIRLSLHLSPRDRYRAVSSLVAEFGKGMEDFLLRQVKIEVAGAVETAIRSNRLADLRRNGLQQVLAHPWLPETFAKGALIRDSFEVRSIIWPDVDLEKPAPAAATGLRLRVDDELHRLWKRHVDTELRGIAGAQAGGGSTVIAVPVIQLAQYETERLREEYARLYEDPALSLITIATNNYEDLAGEWFRRVDTSPGRLITVDTVGEDKPLRISFRQPIPPEGGRPADPGGTVGTESARAALSQLLPHPRVEFVGITRT